MRIIQNYHFFFFIYFHQISFKFVQNWFKFVQNLLFKMDKEDISVKTYLYLKSYVLIQSIKGPVSLSIELGQDRQIFFSCIQQTLINLIIFKSLQDPDEIIMKKRKGQHSFSQWAYRTNETFQLLNHSQDECFFQWVYSSHQVAKVLEFQLQHQSFQWIFRTDFL